MISSDCYIGDGYSSAGEGTKNITMFLKLGTFVVSFYPRLPSEEKEMDKGHHVTTFFVFLGTGFFSYLCYSFPVHSECLSLRIAASKREKKRTQITKPVIYIYI